MQKFFVILIAFSLILNLYWFSAWLYSFNVSAGHSEAVIVFKGLFGNIPLSLLTLIFFVLTLSAIIAVHYYYLNGSTLSRITSGTKVLTSVTAAVQYFFLFLVIWGSL
jgi:hypothetical protein